MTEAILALDTGADLSADTGAGGTASAGTDQAALSETSGAGTEGQRTATEGTAATGSGADPKSASGSDAQGDGKDKLVPLAALHEAREQLKAMRAKIAELEAKPSLTPAQQAQLDKLTAAESKASEPAEPNFLEDPKGYIDAQVKKATGKADQTADAVKKLNEATAAQTEYQQVVSNTSAKEQEFLKTTPDYYDAVNHARAVRTNQLQIVYPQWTQQQIQAAIGREEIGLAREILQSGGDPAQIVYNYAKTLGYTPKVAPTTNTNGSGKPVDKDAARSLGGGGGADSTGDEVGEDDGGDGITTLNQALQERFGVKKRK